MRVYLLLLLGLGLAAWQTWRQLLHLPYAPECPHCRTVTAQSPHRRFFDRLWIALAATPVRSCTRCGWAGRMRWRLAPERVGRSR